MKRANSHVVIDGIRKAARADPELSKRDLAKRFDVSVHTVTRALQNGAATGQLRFPWRDHRRVEFDPVPGKVSSALVSVEDLKTIDPRERPATARLREQVELPLNPNPQESHG